MSAPDSGNSAPSSASSSAASLSCGRSRSTTTSPEGPQAIPMLYGARVHQSRVTSATLTPLLFPRKHDRQPRARLQTAENSGFAIFVPFCPGRVTLVGDAGELHAGQLELVGPLAGPAEGAGGLMVQVGACRAAG